jgi:hypothetical protein
MNTETETRAGAARAVAHLRARDVLPYGLGRLIPPGTVASVESARTDDERTYHSPDRYLEGSSHAYLITYDDGTTSKWVCGCRHVYALRGA